LSLCAMSSSVNGTVRVDSALFRAAHPHHELV
jgi:hypothetical protein